VTILHIPWIELAIFLPLVGAIWVRFLRNPDTAREHSLWISGVSLLCACAAWLSLDTSGHLQTMAREQSDVGIALFGRDMFVVDELSAPLLPMVALLFLLTELATLRTKVRRFSFASVLVRESISLATFACSSPWAITVLLALGTIPPWLDLRDRGKPTRVYVVHMALFVGLLFAGMAIQSLGPERGHSPLAAVMLMAAVLVRNGVVPLHCWITDLFEHASFGTALLFVTPMVGAYAALRLVLPIAPPWVLHSIVLLSLVTAVYAACMALVQHEARRFFCYVFLSHSSLVLAGLEVATTIGLTAALCVWLSVSLSLAGFGLTLRSVEARTGRLSLDTFHGLYDHMPMLGVLFLVTGLGSIGFPGTLGFVGTELLLEGVNHIYPMMGTAIVVAGALNGLAVLYAYFRVFTGTRHATSIDLRLRWPEQMAVLILTALILGGGLYPQPGVESRYHAAVKLIKDRQQRLALDADFSPPAE